jgi:hypothetical protein
MGAHRIRIVVVLAFVLACIPAAAHAQTTVATVGTDTPISADDGVFVYSRLDPVSGRFALIADEHGMSAPLPIAQRAVPFDVDLGPNVLGHTAAVYSRCVTEPALDGPDDVGTPYGKGRGCVLYEYDLTTRRETMLTATTVPGASEFRPTISGTRIAFARVYDAQRSIPYVYTQSLSSPAPATRLPVGPREQCERERPGPPTCTHPSIASGPTAMDLDGRQLAFGWDFKTVDREGPTDQVRIDTFGGGATVVAQVDGGGLSGPIVDWPTFSGGSLYYATACFGDPSGCVGQHHLDRYNDVTQAQATAPGSRTVLGQARDGDTTYLLTAANQLLCASGCTITASNPLFTQASL